MPFGQKWSQESHQCFRSAGQGSSTLSSKSNIGTRIGPPRHVWVGKVSVGSEGQKYLVGSQDRSGSTDQAKKVTNFRNFFFRIFQSLQQLPPKLTANDPVYDPWQQWEVWDLLGSRLEKFLGPKKNIQNSSLKGQLLGKMLKSAWPKLHPNLFLFLPCGSELTTATDEVEDWDPDRTSRRLLAR